MTCLTFRAGSAALPLFVCACSSSSPSAPPAEVVADSSTASESDAAATGALAEASAAPTCASFVAASLSSCAMPPATGVFLADKCQTCHKSPPINHAPFSLLTYADTLKPDSLCGNVPIWQAMHYVIQPNSVPHMPFGNAPQLTSSEFTTLDGWLTGCAVPSTADAGADDAAGE